jgi:hypothetical protein
MPRAKIEVDLPESAWLAAVSRTFPAGEFRIVTVLAGEDTGIALIHISVDSPMPVLAAIEESDAVVHADLFWAEGGEALVQVEANAPPLLVPLWQAGVPVELPFDVTNGTAAWAVTTSQHRLSAFRAALDETDIEYDVRHVSDVTSSDADRVLTGRQREVLTTAAQLGYYDTPRDATLTDVAARLDISKSNCSELLHRAEGHLVDWFLAANDATSTPIPEYD